MMTISSASTSCASSLGQNLSAEISTLTVFHSYGCICCRSFLPRCLASRPVNYYISMSFIPFSMVVLHSVQLRPHTSCILGWQQSTRRRLQGVTLPLVSVMEFQQKYDVLQASYTKSKQYSLQTMIQIYNSNVKSILLYGSECWRVLESDMKKSNVFHNPCLRRIFRVFWPKVISNIELYKKTSSSSIVDQIQQRCLRWLGHVFYMNQQQIPKVSLHWTSPGRCKPGRPKTTWQRTSTSELKQLDLIWGKAQYLAHK